MSDINKLVQEALSQHDSLDRKTKQKIKHILDKHNVQDDFKYVATPASVAGGAEDLGSRGQPFDDEEGE